jgi:phosphoenolpyruvate carboxykinase (GTP)
MTDTIPDDLIDWHGNPYDKTSDTPAAHPNSRFTAPASQCPIIDPDWENPAGVPISAIIFGGRRKTVVPLIYEALSWQHGVFVGATVSSEKTAAAKGKVGELRHDPFAMLPFCGYNMGEYFAHWIEMGKKTDPKKLPKIFHVNWFKKDEDGNFLWPGFGDNIRILKWIFERTERIENHQKSPVGNLPLAKSLDVTGLSLGPAELSKLFTIDKDQWRKEVDETQEYFSLFGSSLPPELKEELEALRKRLS